MRSWAEWQRIQHWISCWSPTQIFFHCLLCKYSICCILESYVCLPAYLSVREAEGWGENIHTYTGIYKRSLFSGSLLEYARTRDSIHVSCVDSRNWSPRVTICQRHWEWRQESISSASLWEASAGTQCSTPAVFLFKFLNFLVFWFNFFGIIVQDFFFSLSDNKSNSPYGINLHALLWEL